MMCVMWMVRNYVIDRRERQDVQRLKIFHGGVLNDGVRQWLA